MRNWPLLQLLSVILLLVLAGWGLRAVTGSRGERLRVPSTSPVQVGSGWEGNVYFELRSTDSIRHLTIRSVEEQILKMPDAFTYLDADIEWRDRGGNSLWMFYGSVDPEHLPLALRLEVEPDDHPGTTHTEWVTQSDFRFQVEILPLERTVEEGTR